MLSDQYKEYLNLFVDDVDLIYMKDIPELANRLVMRDDELENSLAKAVDALEYLWKVEPLDGDDIQDIVNILHKMLNERNGQK